MDCLLNSLRSQGLTNITRHHILLWILVVQRGLISLGNMLRSLPPRSRQKWPQLIQFLTFIYNCTVIETTGFAPIDLFLSVLAPSVTEAAPLPHWCSTFHQIGVLLWHVPVLLIYLDSRDKCRSWFVSWFGRVIKLACVEKHILQDL